MSTVYEIANERSKQVKAEFRKTESQTTTETKEGRRKQLDHLNKLYNKVSGNDRLVLRSVGSY